MGDKSILVVDDEQDLCEILQYNLESSGYQVDVAYSAEQALEKNLEGYSLMLLDVMMDGMSGFDLLKVIRVERNLYIPTIFVTAKAQEEDLLEGFGLGADDFVKKPFSPKEVVARVNAVIERTKTMEMDEKSEALIRLDSNAKKVILKDDAIAFTKTEFDIFRLLFDKPGKVYTREELKELIWDNHQSVLGRTVDVNITRIRKKLGVYGKCIVTRSGYGYYYNKDLTLQ